MRCQFICCAVVWNGYEEAPCRHCERQGTLVWMEHASCIGTFGSIFPHLRRHDCTLCRYLFLLRLSPHLRRKHNHLYPITKFSNMARSSHKSKACIILMETECPLSTCHWADMAFDAWDVTGKLTFFAELIHPTPFMCCISCMSPLLAFGQCI